MRTPGGASFSSTSTRRLVQKPVIIGLNELHKALTERRADGQENPLALIEEQKLFTSLAGI